MWHNVHRQQHTYMSSSFLQVQQIGSVTLGPFMPCVEAVALTFIIVTCWGGSSGIRTWSQQLTRFLQCFDTVGLVIWPVKIVPEKTIMWWVDVLKPLHYYYSTIFYHMRTRAICMPPYQNTSHCNNYWKQLYWIAEAMALSWQLNDAASRETDEPH